MKELIAHFIIKDGKPEWKNTEYLKTNLPQFEGCNGVLEVKRRWNKRSKEQNNYAWLCMDAIAEQKGVPVDRVYTLCKGLYASRCDLFGYNIPKGISELTVGEMVEFTLSVGLLAKKLGVILPNPDKYKEERDSAPLINE